jgi:hypothetical protein
MQFLLRRLPVALIAATSAIPLLAAEPPVEVDVPVKELIAAMRNEDVDWNGTPAGVLPQIGGATELFAKACGEPTDLLFATLDDPDRFVPAHFLLTCLVLESTPVDGGHWDVLHVVLNLEGPPTIDPAQRAMLKKVWAERLKARRAKGPAKAQLTLKSNVKISAKNLTEAISNRDIRWDGTLLGLRPQVEGASALVLSHWRAELPEQLVAALNDPDRFVAAHVLLGKGLRITLTTSGDRYDQLNVDLPAKGPATIDRVQQGRIKKLWAGRLKQVGR